MLELSLLDLHPPPENITLSISSTDSTALLTFTWNPVAIETLCLIQYQTNATNCSTCSSTITNLTTTTCEAANLTPEGQLCIFIIQILIDGESASEASSPFTVMLRGL